MIMRTVSALQSTNLSIQQILERAVGDVVSAAIAKLLSERVQNLKP
jgi:hypothetical protein